MNAENRPYKTFLRFTEDQDFAEAKCGCILQRSVDGEAHEFLMCDMHRSGAKLWKMAKSFMSSEGK